MSDAEVRDRGHRAGEGLAARLAGIIRDVPDFPRPGVLFKDITTLLRDADAFRDAVDRLAQEFADARVDVVVGIESRGFVLGGAVAYVLGAGFAPARKEGRLPSAKIAMSYTLEYGEAALELHTDAVSSGERVLIVDDLLATGGTAAATVELVRRLGGEIAGVGFVVELGFLGGVSRLEGLRTYSIVRV